MSKDIYNITEFAAFKGGFLKESGREGGGERREERGRESEMEAEVGTGVRE